MASGDADTPSRFDPYGPNALADETRQAQMAVANDAPVDVNPNAVIAREQAGTLVLMGKNFEAGANRRNIIADEMMKKMT